MACQSAQPADGACDRQPRLAAPFRPRDRPLAQQFGFGATSRRIRSCSISSRPSSSRSGWQLKALHKLIMMSNAYRMSSTGERGGAGEGPAERSVLAVRHAAADGRGDPRLDPRGHRQAEPEDGRPGHLPDDLRRRSWPASRARAKGWDKSTPGGGARRSVYIHVKRSLVVPISRRSTGRHRLQLPGPVHHDPADPGAGCSTATSSTSRPAFAERLQKQAGDDPEPGCAALARALPRHRT